MGHKELSQVRFLISWLRAKDHAFIPFLEKNRHDPSAQGDTTNQGDQSLTSVPPARSTEVKIPKAMGFPIFFFFYCGVSTPENRKF